MLFQRLIVEGVERAQARASSSYFWPLRLLERMSSWATGMFRVLRRRSNTLKTLYRPHKSQFSRPYKTQRRRDQVTSSSSGHQLVSTSENRNEKYFGANNWRPVTNPDLMRTDQKPTISPELTERTEEAVNDSNYWKILPNFVTSSGSKLRTYFWRHFPRILNRSSNGRSHYQTDIYRGQDSKMLKLLLISVELGYWVPGRPGPLVWGDLEGKLEKVQNQHIKMFPQKLNVTSRDP